jgi:hypothetical protein
MPLTGRFTADVQQALTNAGYPTAVDNDWGSGTKASVQAFQNANNMGATGLPEPEVLHALGIPIPSYPGAADIANALASTLGGVVAPRDAVKILLSESGMESGLKSINYQKGVPVAAGVFQLLVSEIPAFTGMSLDQWITLTPAQQVPYAAKFWKQKAAGNGAHPPLSPRDLYWLNYLPATYVAGAPDDYVFVKDDDTWLNRSTGQWIHNAGYYTQNTGLDHPLTPNGPKKGYITAGDMALAADRATMGNPATYAAIADAVEQLGVG